MRERGVERETERERELFLRRVGSQFSGRGAKTVHNLTLKHNLTLAGAPLLNTYRSSSDARAVPLVCLHKVFYARKLTDLYHTPSMST